MADFKVGDEIICIHAGVQSKQGYHYTVLYVDGRIGYDGHQVVRIVLSHHTTGHGYLASSRRFELVKNTNVERVTLSENFNLIKGKLDEEDLIVIRDHIRGAA
jgi:N-acetyl-gamma-glutamylphosphate reductase